ncbi:MAG: aminotransferase class I/II-fold pyridoxal phosphate-dependent enzyme [Aerococcus sp.]|nr:aminotransferase class I/II-fold pyridoxal phosphate-dependent enzyme [Aerococcus sp.]
MSDGGLLSKNGKKEKTERLSDLQVSQLVNQFVDDIFNHYDQREFNPLTGFLNRQEVRRKVELSPISDEGIPLNQAVKEEIQALEHDANLRHPRYYGFIPGPAQSISWIGDMIAQAYNSHAGGWHLAPGVSAMEKAVVDWALERVGYAGYPYAGGLLESGGTMAGVTALAAARDAKLNIQDIAKATAYMTDQTHTANHKALHLIGIPRENWRYVKTENFKMVTSDLKEKIKEDRENGKIPFVVIGTCGTTNTGAIDPLEEIADVCAANDLWFHVDAAYGGSVVLSDDKDLAKGIERSDSIAWDGHKWLYQIYGIAFCLVKDIRHLLKTYKVGGEYLQDIEGVAKKPDWWDMGPELTRPSRGPRLWLTLQTFGTKRLSSMVNTSIKNAEWCEEQIVNSNRLELVSPASLAIVTFRVKAETDAESEKRNLALAECLRKNNIAGIFTTEVDHKNVLRICTISPDETIDDLKAVFHSIDAILDDQESH